jgi:hypothetical protein
MLPNCEDKIFLLSHLSQTCRTVKEEIVVLLFRSDRQSAPPPPIAADVYRPEGKAMLQIEQRNF